MLIVLLLLTLAGGALSCTAIVVAARRVSRLRFMTQRQEQEIDFLEVYEAAMGDPAVEATLEQKKERHPLLTGLLWGSEPRTKTQNEFLRAELGLPAWLTMLGAAVSTVASAASLPLQV